MTDDNVIRDIGRELGRIAEHWGLPRMIGKVWMQIYFKGEMTQEQLRDDLNSSLGSISQSLKILTHLGVIEITGKRGRKKVYCASELTKAKRKQIHFALNFQIQPLRELLSEKLSEIKSQDTKEKIKKLDKMYAKIEGIIKVVLKMPFGK